ncbi:MAG: hypothetical protein HZB67_02345 [Candidatus Aenigmarchaeota archaeon]|nr:hypothetical protein [Candidatus Aenigmarchaeota archaeon]
MGAFESVANWLLSSGIQNITSNEKNGSFNSWYDIDSGSYPYMYSEITGYGITALLYLYDITGKEIFLERAKLAGDWLLSVIQDCGGVIAKIYHDGRKDERIFAFDNGMVLYGLANLARVSGDNSYSDGTKRIADFLLLMQSSGMNALFDTEHGPFNSKEKWSTQAGGYHAKLSLGLLEAAKILGRSKYAKAAEELCNKAIKFQDPSGRFVFDTLSDAKATHLHPHAYACEGLVYADKFLGRQRFMDNVERAVKWSLDQQMSDGGLPTLCSPTSSDKSQRTDILSQHVRLGVLMLQEGRLAGYSERINALLKRLMSFQNNSGKQAGGFFYGYENGKKMNHINSWCSMFALQAVRYGEHGKKVKIDYFV